MKFYVSRNGYYASEYDVTLAPETKDRLKKAAWIAYWSGVVGIVGTAIYKTNKNKQDELDS